MPQTTGLQFTARLGLLPDDTLAVVDFELREGLSRAFILDLNLASSFAGVEADEVLDQSAELSIWQDGQLQRRVRGIVRSFERGDTGHRRTRYTLQVVPPLWRLSLMHNSRIFQRQDTQAILATLLAERGIVDTAFHLKRPVQARAYCVQHRESDYDFLSRLAAEEGWHLRTDADSDTQALVIADHHRDAP
ncbi:MAG: type VI secretion system tip protein VgrG, partial [Marinobacter sp.]|nr:type VI secretion system tip protein VgrG [Marinobacter sp.]